MPRTVNHRAPVRPSQRPAKPPITAFINGMKTIATNIYNLLIVGI
jgi:hypothetical protein